MARPNPLNEVLLPPWTSGIYSKASTSRAFGLKGKQTNYTHMTYEKNMFVITPLMFKSESGQFQIVVLIALYF